MRIDLLPKTKAFKANLHTHTNLSDGALSPEVVADLYYRHGYQVLALTDHEFIVDHSDLNREDFLLLTGYELQIVDESVRPRKMSQRCCHLCMISKDPHEYVQVYFNPESYDLLRLCKKHELIPSIKSAGVRPEIKIYSREVIEDVVKTAVKNNLLVAFNHPTWSLENDYDNYAYLDGIYAMEIYNNDCSKIGLDEYNPSVYDRILRSGVKTGCIATDDAHEAKPLGDPGCDLFGGWTMIHAEQLSYEAVIRALEKGDFYASTGPGIRELYLEDGVMHISCSDAKRISFTTGTRRAGTVFAEEGKTVNEASYAVQPDDVYVRVTVTDACGNHANTRGYFLPELLE